MTCLLGLSGGIGSGKSTVTQILDELGATTIDADAIVHEQQVAGEPMLVEIAKEFGDGIIRADGSLDREALGAIVFRDPEARTRLGVIVHPRVIAEMQRRANSAVEAGDPLVVLDIPLLFEGAKTGTGAASVLPFDATVAVWATEENQVQRQIERNGYDGEEALRRVRAQLPLDEKRGMADYVIDNSGSLEETERQVREMVESVSAGAA